MEIKGKKLDDRRVAAARENFDFCIAWHKTMRKGKLTFEELLERLASDCDSLASVAKEHGVSREAMRMTYNRYFRDLFPGRKTGRQRERVCTLKRSKVMEQDFSVDNVESWVLAIISGAQENGLSVRRCKRRNFLTASLATLNSFKRSELLINGKQCSLRLLTHGKSISPGARGYSKCRVERKKEIPYDFLIVRQVVEEGRTFILPVTDLLERFGRGKAFSINLPVKRVSSYTAVNDRSGWFRYENAWHLLKA